MTDPRNISIGVDGDPKGGYIVDVHDGENNRIYSPEGDITRLEAAEMALEEHLKAIPGLQRLELLVESWHMHEGEKTLLKDPEHIVPRPPQQPPKSTAKEPERPPEPDKGLDPLQATGGAAQPGPTNPSSRPGTTSPSPSSAPSTGSSPSPQPSTPSQGGDPAKT